MTVDVPPSISLEWLRKRKTTPQLRLGCLDKAVPVNLAEEGRMGQKVGSLGFLVGHHPTENAPQWF